MFFTTLALLFSADIPKPIVVKTADDMRAILTRQNALDGITACRFECVDFEDPVHFMVNLYLGSLACADFKTLGQAGFNAKTDCMVLLVDCNNPAVMDVLCEEVMSNKFEGIGLAGSMDLELRDCLDSYLPRLLQPGKSTSITIPGIDLPMVVHTAKEMEKV